jgi:hypothetical protein
MTIKSSIFQFFLGIFHSLKLFIRIFKSTNKYEEINYNDEDKSSKSNKTDETTDLFLLSDSIQKNIRYFCLINAAVLFSCVCYFDYILLPFLDWITYKIIWKRYQSYITFIINNMFQIVILYFWTLSTCLFYFVLQLLKYFKNPKEKANIIKVIFKQMTNFLTNTVDIATVFTFKFILLVESLLMLLIPLSFLSKLLFHIHFAFFLSFMVFDFKWSLMNWSVKERIDFMESRCTYFLGFGLVLSLIFCYPGSLVYNTTFSTFLIPIIIFNGLETKCEHLKPVSIRFPIFEKIFILNILLNFFDSKNSHSTHQKQLITNNIHKDNYCKQMKKT